MYRAAPGVYRAVKWHGDIAIAVGGGNNGGTNGDTGEAQTAVCSDLTATIGYVKRGSVTENAADHIKKLVVADIGIVLALLDMSKRMGRE